MRRKTLKKIRLFFSLAISALLILPSTQTKAAEESYIKRISGSSDECMMYDFSTFDNAAEFINNSKYTLSNLSIKVRQVTYGGIALQLQGWNNKEFSFTLGNMGYAKKNYSFVKVCYDIQGYTAKNTNSSGSAVARIGIANNEGNAANLYAVKIEQGNTYGKYTDMRSNDEIQPLEYVSTYGRLPESVKKSSNDLLTLYFGASSLPKCDVCVNIKYIAFFKTEDALKSFDESICESSFNGMKLRIDGFSHTISGRLDSSMSKKEAEQLKTSEIDFELYNNEADLGRSYSYGYIKKQNCSALPKGEHFDVSYSDSEMILTAKFNVTNLMRKESIWTVTLKAALDDSKPLPQPSVPEPEFLITSEGGYLKVKCRNCPNGYKRIAAVYNKDVLIKTEISDKDSIVLGRMDGEYTVKVFLWKDTESTLIPICEAKEKSLVFNDFGEYDLYNAREKQWEYVPLVSERQKSLDVKGGEGAQKQTFMSASADGSLILSFADVGNILKSTDSGESWKECGRNINANGLSVGAIDPSNPQKVVGATYQGTTITDRVIRQGYTGAGIYVSEDGAETFTQTFIMTDPGELSERDAFAYDLTTKNQNGVEGCARIYFSTTSSGFEYIAAPKNDAERAKNRSYQISEFEKSKGYNSGCGLYASDDGGKSWSRISSDMTNAELAVSAFDGTVFAAKDNKLYKSGDKGKTFTEVIFNGDVYDIKTLIGKGYEKRVYVIGSFGISVSTDNGRSFNVVTGSNYFNNQGGTSSFDVSSKNPDYMAFTKGSRNAEYGAYSDRIYVSHDGGVNWIRAEYNERFDFFKMQPRRNQLVFDPNDENILYSTSDWPWKSVDGGKTFRESAAGAGGACINSWWQPNVNNPDLWLIPIQDFVGAVTTDGAETFTSLMDLNLNIPLHTHSYGGYAASDNVWFLCSRRKWEDAIEGTDQSTVGTSDLLITFDGGKTWENKGRIVTSGYMYNRCGQSKHNPDILYAGNVRSADGGHTWKEMDSRILCIMDLSADGKTMFALGKDGYSCYVSYNDGTDWELYFIAPRNPGMQYDGIQYVLDYNDGDESLYFGMCGMIYRYKDGTFERLEMPEAAADMWWWSYAIDPIHPSVMYAAGYPSNASQFKTYAHKNSVFRTCDYGKTWQVISNTSACDTVALQGAVFGRHMTKSMFVHPKTGYVYVSTANQGLYKFAPPYVTE